MANEVEQEQAEPADVPASVGAAYVVGIGASAGALSALRTLFGAMPRAPGFACVVVVHLSPEHDSHLVELLQPYTFMTVQQVRETTLLEPNNVYVIPPNANLEAIDTHVRLSALEQRRVERAPIDHFLRTLAKVHDGRAIGVILTGSGSDGSLGLRQIRERGGFTIAQDPQEAEFDSMPRRAILTDTVDCVLKLREIPGAIMNFCSSQPQLELKDGGTDTAENVALAEIVDLLRATTGQEFRFLRRSVMLRKIKRRMQMRRVATLEAYLEVLHTHKNEPRALCNDLLFIATDFFEDRELFGRIERDIVPAIFASKTDEGSRVRVWSIGCSTGEEAYSLAMLLAEQSARLHNPPATQVFASDLSPDTLMQAREGIYPHEVAETVSAERLGRFFHEEGSSYRVNHDLRNQVVFAEHNVLRDPPYAHIDLIVCRNLLAELRPEVRRAVLGMFYYALDPGGRLVVGPRDQIDEPLLFEYEDPHTGVLKPLPGAPRRLMHGPDWMREGPEVLNYQVPSHAQVRAASELAAIHYRMMEPYTPPSLLLGANEVVAYYSPSAGRYVRIPGGEPTADAFHVLVPPLPIVLRRLLERSRRDGSAASSEPFTVETESGAKRIALRVQPPGPSSGHFTLVVIDELRDPSPDPVAPTRLVASLQAEIERVHAQLSDVLSRQRSDREVLEDSNTQLESSNEELRFIVEQLEASKEEVQAANEELTTLDIENRQRVFELGEVSAVLRHLLKATGLATLFLDTDLRIVRYTPQLGELFAVRDVDIGRPVGDIASKLHYEHLIEDARRTLDHLTTIDSEVHSNAGRWYLARMLPYRSTTDRVEGVVVTFVDITDRKNAEQELRDADRRKDEFLALLAHELRNPLAPIVAGIDLLRQAKEKPEQLDQITATMSRQAKQLVRLVDDLLELSRVSGGRLRLRKSRVPLRDVVRDAVASVRPMIDRQRHELRVTLPDDAIELEADSARLTQVFANLLNNAARYTPEGGRIAIEAVREGDEAVVTVSDNGIGISPPTLTRVFEMFYQGEDARPARVGGLGIGLTLARSLVEMHGGTIMASSAGSNRGSEFKVRLPIADRPAVVDASEEPAARTTLGGHRVLIVDDNADAAKTLGMLVETLGQNEVHVANNGSDALRIAQEHRPDIVLLDLKMPGMDGYEVARRLRNESWGRDLTLVAVTGWALEDHKRRSRDAGFDRHLTKPADVAALAAVLSTEARVPVAGTQPSI